MRPRARCLGRSNPSPSPSPSPNPSPNPNPYPSPNPNPNQVSWTLGGRSMGPPVELLEGRSTQIANPNPNPNPITLTRSLDADC
eukprot:scaffold60501_cov51-Phaeocystis_antarctica.AAC.2